MKTVFLVNGHLTTKADFCKVIKDYQSKVNCPKKVEAAITKSGMLAFNVHEIPILL